MEKHQIRLGILISIVIIFGLISLSFCIIAEFNKSKKKDLRLDGKQCYLPGSKAFELGIAALVSLFIAQLIGNLLVCNEFCSTKQDQNRPPAFAIVLQILSWISFGTTAILLGAASSMNRNQGMGEGWLDGECYIVKDGVYFGSAVLVLITLSSIITTALILTRRKSSELATKVHAQTQS